MDYAGKATHASDVICTESLDLIIPQFSELSLVVSAYLARVILYPVRRDAGADEAFLHVLFQAGIGVDAEAQTHLTGGFLISQLLTTWAEALRWELVTGPW